MGSPQFVLVEREEIGHRRFWMVHTAEPRLSVEIEPVVDADGAVIGGTIRRLRIPNAWSPTYDRQGALLGQALEAFRVALATTGLRVGRR